MAGYLRQAELYGDMRRIMLSSVFFARDIIVANTYITDGLGVARSALQSCSAEFGKIMSDHFPMTVAHDITESFRALYTAVSGNSAAKTNTPERLSTTLAVAMSMADYGGMRDKMNQIACNFAEYAKHTTQKSHETALEIFQNIMNDSQTLADMIARAMADKFPDRYK